MGTVGLLSRGRGGRFSRHRRRLESRRHAFTSVFALGALALALLAPEVRQTSLAAAATGGVMLAVAVIILIRAHTRHRALLARKEQLEREVAG